jgi:signal transduction histidine kinase
MKMLSFSIQAFFQCSVLLMAFSFADAQPTFLVKKYSEAEGLPKLPIHCLWLESNGITTIETTSGEFLFDGNSIHSNNKTAHGCKNHPQFENNKLNVSINEVKISCTSNKLGEILIQKENAASVKQTIVKYLHNTTVNFRATQLKLFSNNGKLYALTGEGIFSITENQDGNFLAEEVVPAAYTSQENYSTATISPDEKTILLANNNGELVKIQKNTWLINKQCSDINCQNNLVPLITIKNLQIDTGILKTNGAIEDKLNRVWMFSPNGIFISTKMTIAKAAKEHTVLQYWKLDKLAGLPSSTFTKENLQNSFYNASNGHLRLNAGKDFFEINTNELETKSIAYPAIIEKTYLDNTLLTNWPKQLSSFNSLRLHMTIPLADKYKNYPIEYRITPGANNWTLCNGNTIFIDKLNPGEQTLEIRYNNSLSTEDYIYSRFPLYFMPSWYQTKWFRVGLILLGLGLIALFYFIREYRFRKANNELNIKVEQKTLEIKRQMRKLKGLTQQNDMLIGVIAHDIKSPLRSISTLSSIIGSNLDQTNPEEVAMHLKDISKTSDKLSHFIGQFLTWYGQKNEKNVTKESVNINKLLAEVVSFITDTNVVKENKIEINCNVDPIIIESNKQILSIIITNLLDNACKYTKNGTIHLIANLQGRELTITCQDNGIGMDEETIEKLLNNETKFNPQTPESYKLGYVFINGLIKQINGKLTIESQPGKGSSITIQLRLR